MKIKLPALLALSLLLFAGSAQALQTDDLIAVSAMPLAVADVVALPDVPQNDVMTVVTTLNRAAVPAPQFVEIVRYAPVALVEPVQTGQPRFVTYVTQQYDSGVVGQPLALAISDRYNSYGIDDVQIQNPPVVTYVEQQQFLPQVVVTQFQPVQFDPLSVIAMPLAVAAVADLVNVPTNDLMQLVASLNQAAVPAPQFVEVVRYSPVVFVDRNASPQFIRYVTTEVDRGVYGRPLAYAIADRIQTYEPVQINVRQPRVVQHYVAPEEMLPPIVRTRVASAHPHGGPPGQLKKELGLQTGAEVVHGSLPRHVAPTRTVERVDRSVAKPHAAKQHVAKQHVARQHSAPAQPRVEKPRKVKVEHKQQAPRVMRQPAPPQHVQPQRMQQRAPKAHGHGNAGGGHGQGKGKKKG